MSARRFFAPSSARCATCCAPAAMLSACSAIGGQTRRVLPSRPWSHWPQRPAETRGAPADLRFRRSHRQCSLHNRPMRAIAADTRENKVNAAINENPIPSPAPHRMACHGCSIPFSTRARATATAHGQWKGAGDQAEIFQFQFRHASP